MENKTFGKKTYEKGSFSHNGANRGPLDGENNRTSDRANEKRGDFSRGGTNRSFDRSVDRKNTRPAQDNNKFKYINNKKTNFHEEFRKNGYLKHQNNRQGQDGETVGNGAVIGRNAVRELFRSGRAVDKLLVQSGEHEGALIPLVSEAIARGIPVVETERRKLDSLSGFVPHQGIIAMAAEKEYCTVDDILQIAAERGEKPLIVIADGINDPYNLGAVIRCAEGCGAHGLIIPKRHAAGLTPLVTKSSAGAIEHLAIAKVSNINQTIEVLKKAGIWVFAAEANGTPYDEIDMSVPTAIIMGSEGEGVSELVRKNSDFVVSIPMYGNVNSFNVSTAAAVLLCEAARQQRRK